MNVAQTSSLALKKVTWFTRLPVNWMPWPPLNVLPVHGLVAYVVTAALLWVTATQAQSAFRTAA